MNIKKVIKAHNYTINQVADKMGKNRVTLSQTIARNPTVETLQRIADTIGCKVGEFFADENERPFVMFIHNGTNHTPASVKEVFTLIKEWRADEFGQCCCTEALSYIRTVNISDPDILAALTTLEKLLDKETFCRCGATPEEGARDE